MQAYEAMDTDDRNRLEIMGVGMIVVGGGVPVVAGIFYELSIAYWVFAGALASIGVCFLFPALGTWFIDAAMKLVAKVVPSMRDKIKPDRRGDGTEG